MQVFFWTDTTLEAQPQARESTSATPKDQPIEGAAEGDTHPPKIWRLFTHVGRTELLLAIEVWVESPAHVHVDVSVTVSMVWHS